MATHKSVDHLAGKLLKTSRDLAVRSVAAAALSDRNPLPTPAHTRNRVASLAGALLQDGNKTERSVAASVLSDHKRTKRH